MTIRHLKVPALSAALALGCASHALAQPAQGEQIEFAIPSMPLGDALRELAKRSGRNLVVDDALIAGKVAAPLTGRLSPEQGVRRLLAGTGLSSRTVDGTIVVSADPLNVAAGETTEALRQSEIVVTGTHVRGAPPTSPVITLSRRQIEETGVSSVEDLMRRVPQNLSAGVGQENFAVTGTGADITDHGAGINLRGLGQRATLVLVNGRRMAPSGTGSFVDVSLIPISAIERVEILTDGASAIYGSDAVGGVVNFILRKDYQGLESLLQVGTTTEGGGTRILADLTAGTRWTGGRALVSYEYRDDRPVKARDRDFTINLPGSWDLFPRERKHSLYGTAHQELTSNLALDASATFASRKTERSFLDGGLPVAAAASARSYGGDLALQLDLGSWNAEASASGYVTRSRERQTQSGSLFNLYNSTNSFGELAAKADGSLLELPAGPAKLAVGGSVRREHFSSLFATSVNTPTSADGSRTIEALYGELNIPLFAARNAQPGLQQLTLSGAGRFEHYQAIGSSFNPKIGLLWSPVRDLVLRSSYGTSFRAPLLSESFGYYNIFLFPASLVYVDPSQAPSGVSAVLAGNNPSVKPERSKSFSLGGEWTPRAIRGLRLGATYYAIEFTNRIALPSEQIVVAGNPAFAPIVTVNPAVSVVDSLFAGANQLLDFSGPGFTDGDATPADVVTIVDGRVSNTAATRTSGMDFLLNYEFSLGRDRFRAELDANRVFRFDDKLTMASPWIHNLDTPFHAIKWKARGGLSWNRGPFSAFGFINYTASYHDNRALVVRPVRSLTTIDAGASFDGTATGPFQRWKIALNVQNLLGTRPPQLLPQPGFNQDVGYDTVNATGFGRFVSLQLRKRW